MNKAENQKSLGIAEMMSYGGVQLSSTIFVAFSAYYLMSFLTDVALIPPAATAVLLMFMHLCGALDGLLIGLFINRANFKHGKYRPYYLWLAFPFAISLILMGSVPPFGAGVKIAYAAVTLILCQVCWSVLDMAAWSSLPYLARNDVNRTKFVSFSNASSILAFLVVGTFMMPLVELTGGRSRQLGFMLTMTLFAIISVPLLINAFFRLKEQHNVPQVDKPNLRDIISAIGQNRRIMLFLAGYCVFLMADSFKNQTTYYYMTINMGRSDLLPVVIMAGIIVSLASQPFIPKLLSFAAKETLIVAGLFMSSLCSIAMLLAGNNITGLIVCVMLYGAFISVPANLAFTLMASFTDEIRLGRNMGISEFLTSGMRISSKVGLALASGIAPLTLSLAGYSAQAAQQSQTALTGIKILFIVCTAIGLSLSGIIMLSLKRNTQHKPLHNIN